MKASPRNPAFAENSSPEVPTAPPQPRCAVPCAQPPASADREKHTPEAETLQRTYPMPAHTPEMRDAKVRALQQAVEQGTYHVPAEQLAAKMLRDALQELLP
jgi:flagellar biosynthesis anti-sigma factor FlgM